MYVNMAINPNYLEDEAVRNAMQQMMPQISYEITQHGNILLVKKELILSGAYKLQASFESENLSMMLSKAFEEDRYRRFYY